MRLRSMLFPTTRRSSGARRRAASRFGDDLVLQCEIDMSDPRVSGTETIEQYRGFAEGSGVVSGSSIEMSSPMRRAPGEGTLRVQTTVRESRSASPTSSMRARTGFWSSATTSPNQPGPEATPICEGGSRSHCRPIRHRRPQRLHRSIPSQLDRSPSVVGRPAIARAAGRSANSTCRIPWSAARRHRTVSASSPEGSARGTCR